MKKVIFITEYINPPFDEGIKKTAYNLFLELDKNYDLKVICRYGFEKDNVHIIDTNRLFASNKIKSLIKKFNPDSLVYLPFQSSTFASYMRLRLLSLFTKNGNIILIALQPKPLKKWQKMIIKFIKPSFALTPSPVLKEFWDSIHQKSKLIPLLTNLSIFKPLEKNQDKRLLRQKYDLPVDAFIISHMGHLNRGRNLQSLIPVQQKNNQVLIVASSSTPVDAEGEESIEQELNNSGIIILNKYIENIQEVYQLSDVYIFPVVEKNSSIGLPLSILEARSCGIPVITTDFGSVKLFLDTDFGSIFYSDPDKFADSINVIKENSIMNINKTKVSELNQLFYHAIHNQIES